MRVSFALLACLLALAAGCTDREELAVSVTPETGLVDEPFDVRVTGAAPGESVRITVATESEGGAAWSLTREARADDAGGVVLPDEYLLANLRPGRDAPEDDYLLPPFSLEVTVGAGDEEAATSVRRFVRSDSVKVSELQIDDVGFRGRWWVPTEDARRTAILLLGGSEGGIAGDLLLASVLAGRGYPVLALAYFGLPGLPSELARIPLEYFRTALEWLRRQEGVDPDRIVAFGGSRGGELALILGSTYRDLVDAVVGYVPNSNVFPAIPDVDQPAWTLRGEPLESTLIPVERIDGPVFVVGGGDDQLWPSGTSVDFIGRQLELSGHRDFVALSYPKAGHSVGLAVPNIQTSTSAETRYGRLYFGGTPEADEAAREDSWPKLLRFLDEL